MTDSLTQEQRRALRERLDGRYRELREAVRRELAESEHQSYADLAGQVHDPGDESVADLIADLEIAEVDRHVEEIRAVEHALARMRAGEYGVCADCGEQIAHERLEAQPTAMRCYTCQTRYERTYARGGVGPTEESF